MFEPLRRLLCVVLACCLVALPTASAQTPEPNVNAPIPPQILSAHSVFVSNGGGDSYFDGFTGGSDRAYNILYAEIKHSNHYQLVNSPSQADLVFEIRGIATTVDYGDTVGTNPQLRLSVIDPKSRAILWTTNANVRAFGNKKHRDQALDQSVTVVLSKFGEVTGQTLTPEQAKAVRDNSHMPTSAKVFIFAGIAAVAGLAIYGIYRGTHPPKLTMPTLPAAHSF